MKVIAKPVDVVAWFENKGIINPIKFRMKCEDDSYKVIKIDNPKDKYEETYILEKEMS